MANFVIKRSLIFLVGLLLIIGYPLLVFCLTPIYLMRIIANFLKVWFRPDLGELLTPGSNLLATDEIWTNPKATIVNSYTLQGRLTLENLRSNFINRILKSEKKNGACLHPELLQYPSTWLGFPVWVNEVNFSIEEHIKYYDGPVTFDIFNESALYDVMGELTLRPFTPGKSIWEMYVFNDYHFEGDLEPDQAKSIMIIRIHHCMVDGFSANKFLDAIGDIDLHKWMPTVQSNTHQSVILTCCKRFYELLQLPFHSAETVFLNLDPIGPWHINPSNFGAKYGFGVSSKISLNLVKKIRDLHQATTTGVILAAISGALRRIMLESGKPVPEKVLTFFPTPMPDHPDKFTNHMMIAVYSLPVGTVSAVERLKATNRFMKSVKKSTVPFFSFYHGILMGSLYAAMTKFQSFHYPGSFVTSSFVGPTPGSKFIGLPIIDSVIFQAFNVFGMGCFIVSTNGNIRILFGINEALVSDYDASAKRFAKYIVCEFDELLANEDGFEKTDSVTKKMS